MCFTQPTLYLIGDEPKILQILHRLAQSIGIPFQTFRTAEEYFDAYSSDQHGCLILNARPTGLRGDVLQEKLNDRKFTIPLIVISVEAEIQSAVRAIRAGVLDYLETPFREQELLDRIQAGFEIDSQRRIKILRCQGCMTRYDSLTPRERDVMTLLIQGKSGKQAAESLIISYKTMEKYRSNLMRKLQIPNVAELVLFAVRLNLISAEEILIQNIESENIK